LYGRSPNRRKQTAFAALSLKTGLLKNVSKAAQDTNRGWVIQWSSPLFNIPMQFLD
jgi:hypothetical protein